MDKITQFREEYSWLSNFQYFEQPMKYGNLVFSTNEHFYVTMKTLDCDLRKQVSNHPSKGLKKFGKSLPIRQDWEDIKLNVMLYGLRYKFSKHNPSLRDKLIKTGELVIEEGNWWVILFGEFVLKRRKVKII